MSDEVKYPEPPKTVIVRVQTPQPDNPFLSREYTYVRHSIYMKTQGDLSLANVQLSRYELAVLDSMDLIVEQLTEQTGDAEYARRGAEEFKMRFDKFLSGELPSE